MTRHVPRPADRLRREYLCQDAGAAAPCPASVPSVGKHAGQGLTLDGHRLSSLFRSQEAGIAGLTNGERAFSSWQKYAFLAAATAEPVSGGAHARHRPCAGIAGFAGRREPGR
jgi:hypothetical protein